MSEPTTAAGRALLSAAAANEAPVWSGPDLVALEAAVLKIEAEARAQGALHENLAAEGDIERAVAAYRADLAAKVLANRAEIIRAVAGIDGYENPNTAPGSWWDRRCEPVIAAVLDLIEGEPR